MPTNLRYTEYPGDIDPRLWARCRAIAEKAMVAAGWNPKAGKFREVSTRKARQEWNRIHRA